MKNNRQKQRFCHPKMADLKAWSYGVRKVNLPFSAGHMSDVRRYFKAWNQAKAIENFIDFYWQDLFGRNDLQRIQMRNRQMPFWLPTYPYVRTQKIAEMKFALN